MTTSNSESTWRDDFCTTYRLVKRYCSISDEAIATAVSVEVDSVRQYAGNRKTMPEDIDSLCFLFEKEIAKLPLLNRRTLLAEVQKGCNKSFEFIPDELIGQSICTMIKQFHSNEKSHLPYHSDYGLNFEPSGHIQAIVFDFDGTLTRAKVKTTWESIWESLGYNVEDCRRLHKRFDKHEFSHQEWCDITAERFIERKLTRQHIVELSKSIRLIPGCEKTLRCLKDRNIKLYIVSGSIKDIIESVLGNTHSYFTEIKANEFLFDRETGVLSKIIGTKYDFWGKANYIRYIAKRLEIAPADILFIGNSNNDTLVYQSGAKTLCINPIHTNYHDETIWHDTIVDCKNLLEILPFVT